MAQHDGLTGLPNRNLLRQQMDEMLLHTRRSAEKVAVLCSASTISRRSTIRSATASATSCCAASPSGCARSLREEDTLARLNSDEFAIVQSGLTRPGGCGAAGAAPAGGDRRALSARRPFRRDRRQHRHRDGARRRRRLRKAAEERRHGAVPRQGRFARHLLASSRPAWTRAPRRRRKLEIDLRDADPERRAAAALPAAGRSRDRPDHRLRGAGALAASRARHDLAGRIHSGRRGDRPDQCRSAA